MKGNTIPSLPGFFLRFIYVIPAGKATVISDLNIHNTVNSKSGVIRVTLNIPVPLNSRISRIERSNICRHSGLLIKDPASTHISREMTTIIIERVNNKTTGTGGSLEILELSISGGIEPCGKNDPLVITDISYCCFCDVRVDFNFGSVDVVALEGRVSVAVVVVRVGLDSDSCDIGVVHPVTREDVGICKSGPNR